MFQDLKVVELASVLAGPLTGRFFSELGAKVLKIENKTTNGDVTRSWKTPTEATDLNVSSYYAAANWGKQSILLDYTQPNEYEWLLSQIESADVLIVNFKPGDAEKFNLSYDRLKNINNRLIYASLTGFGSESKRTAYDVVLQAEAGYMQLNGEPEGEPTKMPLALMDILAAHQLKEGILTALLNRHQTNRGSLVEVNLYQSAISAWANQASYVLNTGLNPVRQGSLHPTIAPYGELFTTADEKQLVLAIGNDKQFTTLCKLLDRLDMATDTRFSNNQQRVIHRQVLFTELTKSFIAQDAAYWMAIFEKHDLPSGVVRNLQEVLNDPQNLPLIQTEQYAPEYTGKSIQTVAFRLSE